MIDSKSSQIVSCIAAPIPNVPNRISQGPGTILEIILFSFAFLNAGWSLGLSMCLVIVTVYFTSLKMTKSQVHPTSLCRYRNMNYFSVLSHHFLPELTNVSFAVNLTKPTLVPKCIICHIWAATLLTRYQKTAFTRTIQKYDRCKWPFYSSWLHIGSQNLFRSGGFVILWN